MWKKLAAIFGVINVFWAILLSLGGVISLAFDDSSYTTVHMYFVLLEVVVLMLSSILICIVSFTKRTKLLLFLWGMFLFVQLLDAIVFKTIGFSILISLIFAVPAFFYSRTSPSKAVTQQRGSNTQNNLNKVNYEILLDQEQPGELMKEEWYTNTYEIERRYAGWIRGTISKEKNIRLEDIKEDILHTEWLEKGRDIQFIYATASGERIYVGADFEDGQLKNIRVL